MVLVANLFSGCTHGVVRESFPGACVDESRIPGFAHAARPGLICRARHVCFVNPDTDISAAKGRVTPKLIAEHPYARRQYATKRFGTAARGAHLDALGADHLLRAVALNEDATASIAARFALRALAGPRAQLFRGPPATSVTESTTATHSGGADDE